MLQGLRVVHAPKWEGVLSLNSDSVIYLQSFLLSKLNLYFQIYYHHKLRALECMFRGALEQAMETGGHLPSTIENWFDISENDLISVAPSLMKRNVIKRCLVLDRTTVEQESHRSLNRLASDVENRHTLRRLREEIYENLPAHARTSFAELWIDSPTLPYISRQMLMCPIWMAGEVIALNDLFPLDSLFHAYVADKARIYVFYSDNPVGRQLVADIAERIFREEYGICLKPLAKALALQDMSDDT
jgi:HD superfamily phosphohydrolase